MFVTVRQASVRRRHGWLRALLPPRRWKSRWCVFPAGRSSCFPYGSGEEAGGEESSIPSDDLGTLATGGCYVAERGSEHLGLRQRPPLRCRVSYRDVTGTNTMAEIITIDRPSVAKPVSRPQSRKPATVSASALALHLDCSRTYIGKLEVEGVIQRQGDVRAEGRGG